MNYFKILTAGFVFFCSASVHAADLHVAEGVITTLIRSHSPADAVQTYPATGGKLYCFTRISGGDANSSVFHVWYREGVEMARIELPVRSSDWRTWSAKTLLPEWTGSWKVEILDGDGKLLRTVPFTLI
jgi:hypothetical protein